MGKKSRQKKVSPKTPLAKAPSMPPPSRRVLLILLLILAAGLALRAAYFAELKTLPDFEQPLVDSHYHDYWARAMATGDWSPPQHEPDPQISKTPYFRPPGYPYFLASIYSVLGQGYVTPRVVQMFLGLATAVLVFFLGRRLFGDGTGLIAAGLMATYWIFIYFEGEFLEPALSVPLTLAFVWFLVKWYDRPSVRFALLSGIMLGLLALARPNALVLIPVAGLWLFWVGRRLVSGRGVLKPGPGRSLVVLIVGTLAVILPVTIRNYAVSGDVVLISSNAGINLLIGNSERADGEVRGTMPGIGSLDTSFDYPFIVRRVEQIEGRRMSHAEVGSYLGRRALSRMAKDPGRTLGLMWRKTLLFWGPEEVADNKVIALDRHHSRILRWIPTSFPVLLALGLLGLILIWRTARSVPVMTESPGQGEMSLPAGAWEMTVLILGIVIVWFASHLPIAVTARYRVPVIPFLILYGAFFLHWLVHVVRQKNYGRALPWLAGAVVLLVLCHVDMAGYTASAARWHYQRGIAFQQGRDLDGAIVEFKEAIAENPRFGAAFNDLATALAIQGKVPESVPYFRQAMQLSPGDATTHRNLAQALEFVGEREESHRHYGEALRLTPKDPEARAGYERTRGATESAPPDPSPR